MPPDYAARAIFAARAIVGPLFAARAINAASFAASAMDPTSFAASIAAKGIDLVASGTYWRTGLQISWQQLTETETELN